MPVGEVRAALGRLTACGLLRTVRGGEHDSGYVPGPQLSRLTPAGRSRGRLESVRDGLLDVSGQRWNWSCGGYMMAEAAVGYRWW